MGLSSSREQTTVRSRRARVQIVVGVALVVALAVLIPTVLHAGSSSPQTKADPPVAAADPTTRELLAVLDRQRRRADRLPQPPAGADRDAFSDRTPGEAYGLARRATPGPAADPVYVWPSKNGACFSAGNVSSCATAAQIATEGAIVAFAGGERHGAHVVRVAGIARDGVTAIELTLADGARARARVRDNAFVIDLTRTPLQLRWTTPDGTAHQAQTPFARAPSDSRRPFWRPRTA